MLFLLKFFPPRIIWNYDSANWNGLCQTISVFPWNLPTHQRSALKYLRYFKLKLKWFCKDCDITKRVKNEAVKQILNDRTPTSVDSGHLVIYHCYTLVLLNLAFLIICIRYSGKLSYATPLVSSRTSNLCFFYANIWH